MRFGYKAIETPVLTPADIFAGRYGDNGRLMYTFTDKGKRNVSLPYDLTVPFARYIASQQHRLTFPFKRFQTAKVWRAEKPQKGRLREFVQTDIDIIGSASLLCEAEIIKVIYEALLALGLIDIRIRFNSRRLQNHIFQFLSIAEANVKSLLKIFNQLKNKNECLSALLESGITNNEQVYEALKPEASSQLSIEKLKYTFANDSLTHEIEHFLSLTSELGLNTHLFHFEPTLSRGLDYYTGIVFEIDFNNITSICSGGRYDDLCGKFCTDNFSGVGASFGLDRLTEALLSNQSNLISKKRTHSSDVLVAWFNNHADEAHAQLRIFRSLESLGFLANCGIHPQSTHDRALTTTTNMDGVNIVFLRHADIPEYVQAGVADFGIVGKNLLFEKEYTVLTRLALPFAFCRLVIAVSINSHIQSVKDLDSERIATSYPQSVRKFLKSESIHASISFIQGSVEIAPSLGLAEAICDLTQTGKTLRENNLKELVTTNINVIHNMMTSKLAVHFLHHLSMQDIEQLVKRNKLEQRSLRKKVQSILDDVQRKGDKSVLQFTRQFDKVTLDSQLVLDAEFTQAENLVSENMRRVITTAAQNIQTFHKSSFWEKSPVVETTAGILCHSETRPIQKVGLYVPGGSAPLISTVLMLAIPAKLAGCQEIILCTPTDKKGNINPHILFAAKHYGITKVFKIGGAQAIAAMAYGTSTVPKVFKIFGPGNQYVTMAKQLVSSAENGPAIDMPSGPTEQLIIADSTAYPKYVTADMLSQAEHGTDSQVILATTSVQFAEAVQNELVEQASVLPRYDIVAQSLKNSFIVIGQSISNLIAFANLYAPEHLLIQTQNPEDIASKIQNAGSVFLGHLSAESIGDYASGPNHALPTYGYARAYSGVSVASFQRIITFQKISKTGLTTIADTVTSLARAEGLEAHARAVEIRLSEKSV
ncbi:hypothetical protein CHS0354_000827 [Potamilus streckersoni]|uniref:Aminoacyl-transfer RNA synthetases class-II family profile domain-containing protein n=1 Tax=Potamilus streckersoni TaxID=2493646 RepID=A0AAE0T7C2_9BIVA|nr:hypothetical protein CHS0354_000827 [Potamilus streckersoni]